MNKYQYNRNLNYMKIEYIYEAGVFGSYKKANTQSNIDNAKKELTRDAALHLIERQCDELAELFFNMLKTPFFLFGH